jgi:isocitrate dehydrogenase (NAD+)
MKHTITLIPGDGIGPEITAAAVRVIEAAGVEVEWETHILGAQALEKFGSTLPEQTIESIRRNKLALKGPQMTPKRAEPLFGRRSGHRSRKYRGTLFGP